MSYTNLRLYDKRKHFNSIWKSAFLRGVDPTSQSVSTDLNLICQLEGDVYVSLPTQSVVLSSQSDFVLELLEMREESTIFLPGVNIQTVQRLLELLYFGECFFSNEYDRFKLLGLLNTLKMENVTKNLQMNQVYKQNDVNLNFLGGESVTDCVTVDKKELKEMQCKVCNLKFDSKKIVEFILHEKECGVSYRQSVAKKKQVSLKKVSPVNVLMGSEMPEKLSKRCPICKQNIKAAGKGWRYPFYSHLARKHFSTLLKRDYITDDWKCRICQKDAESFAGPSKRGQLIAHLGGKHRLIERYINLDEKGEVIKKTNKDKKNDSKTILTPLSEEIDSSQISRKRSLQCNSSGHHSRPKAKSSTTGNVECHYCDQKFTNTAVLQSHLVSKHFKKDCEKAIGTILERTKGKCPLCPKESWQHYTTLDSSIYVHFSLKHKIAEGLLFNNNVLRQENVDSMLRKFFPE